MSAAIRTVVGNDSTSQEAQDYIHQFPIIFINLGGVAKLHIAPLDNKICHAALDPRLIG
ncbi:uncharacterized protein FFNC_15662 [Fusarium fujikuroi]|nr:uncharacterized protein FFNC_15662 [Fusarium fujikuroi]